jgi:hypothetical protein
MKNFHRISSSKHTPFTERINDNKSPLSYLMDKNEKDLIISNQKTKIYQLEQKEKEMDRVNQKYNELEKEYNDINNYKNHLEYEIKKKDNLYNTDLSLLNNRKRTILDELLDLINILYN